MTIGELKQLLDDLQLPETMEIVLSIDPEGNGFRPLTGYSLARFVPSGGYGPGDIASLPEEQEHPPYDTDTVLCLWP